MHALLDRAVKGDASTLPAVRKALEDPILVEAYGNLARQAELSFIHAAAGENLVVQISVSRKLDLLRRTRGTEPNTN